MSLTKAALGDGRYLESGKKAGKVTMLEHTHEEHF